MDATALSSVRFLALPSPSQLPVLAWSHGSLSFVDVLRKHLSWKEYHGNENVRLAYTCLHLKADKPNTSGDWVGLLASHASDTFSSGCSHRAPVGLNLTPQGLHGCVTSVISLFQVLLAPLFFGRDEESGVFRISCVQDCVPHEELSPPTPPTGHLLQHWGLQGGTNSMERQQKGIMNIRRA